MKAGVEDRDLRLWAEQLRGDLHAFQFGVIVEGRKRGNAFDRRLDLSRYDRGLEMLRPAVDHPVSDNIDFGRAGNHLRLAAPQVLEPALDVFPARAARRYVLSGNSAGSLDRVLRLVIFIVIIIGPLDLPFPNRRRWVVRERIPNFVETAFLAAGTGVENKHVHQ